jgi:hypothetical protein
MLRFIFYFPLGPFLFLCGFSLSRRLRLGLFGRLREGTMAKAMSVFHEYSRTRKDCFREYILGFKRYSPLAVGCKDLEFGWMAQNGKKSQAHIEARETVL